MVAIYPNEAFLFSGRILMSANYTISFLKRQADECCMIHADQIIEYHELIDIDSSKTWHHSVPYRFTADLESTRASSSFTK
jgi:hypothetical protein